MDRENEIKIPKRILNTLLVSLGAGVVPRAGAPYIAIGRGDEITALLNDIQYVKDGGAAVRFLIGRYGSGKSFLIQLIRGYALERDFLSADCDLSPERRLSGGSGAGLATYKELLRNLASKASPDGNALVTVLSRLYTAIASALSREGTLPGTPDFKKRLCSAVYEALSSLEGEVGGFDFVRVLYEYYDALAEDDSAKKSSCLRWLRGEFSSKTEARRALGFPVSCIVDDDNWYDFLRLWASLSALLGYSGLVIFIDECVNLYKIPNRISREANYEKLLAIFNDTLQGRSHHLGVIFGGTPQFLEDTRRGLFSYEALRSRLSDSRFTELGFKTMTSPVIRLRRLSDNELLALLMRLSRLFAMQTGREELVSEKEIGEFLSACLRRVGSSELVTPRELIRNFLALLNVLNENEDAVFSELLSRFSGIRSEEDTTLPEEDIGSQGKRENHFFADLDF